MLTEVLMAVAELSVIPIVEGSLRPYVRLAIEEVRKSGLACEVGAMGTTIEGGLDELLKVAGDAHRAVRAAGAGRVVTTIRIDDRDQELTIAGKLEGLR